MSGKNRGVPILHLNSNATFMLFDKVIVLLLQADLYNQNPKAVGFVFKTQPYYLSWGPSGHVNDLILGTYVNKTNFGPEMSSNKLIYKTKYVSPGSVHTHHIIPLEDFEM